MAARAARSRSTATGSGYSGVSGRPVLSSIESPATPVATHAATFDATPSGVAAKPDSKSAFTGRSVAPTMARMLASVASSPAAPSAAPFVHAQPALVVASALNPRRCR